MTETQDTAFHCIACGGMLGYQMEVLYFDKYAMPGETNRDGKRHIVTCAACNRSYAYVTHDIAEQRAGFKMDWKHDVIERYTSDILARMSKEIV